MDQAGLASNAFLDPVRVPLRIALLSDGSDLPSPADSVGSAASAAGFQTRSSVPTSNAKTQLLGVAAAVAATGVLSQSRHRRAGTLSRRARRQVTVKAQAESEASPEGNAKLVRYLSEDGTVSVRAIVATELVREACEKHGCSQAASVALGRALLGVELMASGRDEGETLQLRINGNGPCGSIIAEANSALQCRGFLGDPKAEAGSVPELVGVGAGCFLRVTRMHPFWKTPYSGTTELSSGEIAEDIVQYLALSEQTPASMGLNVMWDEEAGRVKYAEGWLVTLLPGWDQAAVGVVETNIASFGRMDESDRPRAEAICEHMMRELVGKFQLEETPSFRCSCSENKLLTSVMMLGETEVLKIVRDKETVEARCDWCGRQMTVGHDKVRDFMKSDDGKEQVEQGAYSPRQLKLQEDELQKMPAKGEADWS